MTFPRLKADVSAMPLGALQAVVLDTETTGLDVKEDRVVEFGATRIADGKVGAGDDFVQLVNPGVAIPEQSRKIHGLSEKDVADAPPFPEAMERFVAKMEPTLVLGYSLGFDLGVLKAEHGRHDLVWHPPRTVDVAHAVRVLNPPLPNHSLDVVANWLGLKIEGRHRAVADARATAEVFLCLVPLLRENGIETLAQLERKVREMSEAISEEGRHGWVEPAARGLADEGRMAFLARLDSFPYRHRVKDVMQLPQMIDVRSRLSEALHLMVELRVCSLFISKDGKPAGIVTDRDVLRILRDKGEQAMRGDLSFAAKDSLVSVAPDDFIYRALLKMSQEDIRRLAVIDRDKELVGAVTARNLLKIRSEETIMLGERIDDAQSVDELGRVWGELATVVNTLWVEDIDVRDIAAIISRELRALTRRACELAERDMLEEGLGGPPVDYAMLVLGSGGRGESLLAMDQDNAIVYARTGDGDKAKKWMAELGKRVSDMLAAAGLAYCNGGVMASNAEWRMDLVGWHRKVDLWVARSSPEDFLSSDIFFDGVCVHGDRGLAEGLFAHARDKVRASGTFIKFLTLNASKFDTAVGVFGKVRTEGGRVDLKLRGVLPIFSAARALALRHGIDEHSTVARLKRCVELGHGKKKVVDSLIEAHRIMMGLVLGQQLKDINDGIAMSAKVDVGSLSAREKDNLKWALSKVPDINVLLDTPA